MNKLIINTVNYTLTVNREQKNPITKNELTQLIEWCDTVSIGFINKVDFVIDNIDLVGGVSC